LQENAFKNAFTKRTHIKRTHARLALTLKASVDGISSPA
jgi:hypothetical protein